MSDPCSTSPSKRQISKTQELQNVCAAATYHPHCCVPALHPSLSQLCTSRSPSTPSPAAMHSQKYHSPCWYCCECGYSLVATTSAPPHSQKRHSNELPEAWMDADKPDHGDHGVVLRHRARSPELQITGGTAARSPDRRNSRKPKR